ncbi:hypothetical protein EJB05_07626, partial [Eragrostis curvula]
MPKRNRWDDDGGRGSRDSCRRCPPQRHLCVVLDDWSRGYSIYKIDVDGFDGDPDDGDLDLRPHRLPDPPLFRLEIPPDESGRFALFAAVGSRVFAMSYLEQNRDAPVLVHDTASGALAVGPRTPFELQKSPDLVAAGGSLYAYDGCRDGRGGGEQSFKTLLRHGRRGWVWSSLRAAPFDLHRAAMTHEDERSMGAELAHMGDGRFCLVEYLKRRGMPEDCFDEHCRIFATTFRLRYDRNGALRAAARRARCYAVRKKSNTFEFRAFGV